MTSDPQSDFGDAPLTLREACKRFFRGQITPATLRAESKRGRLVIMRVGRADFVTPSAMREMMKKCQDPQKEQGSISIPSNANGSSETDRPQNALAAAKLIGQELKKNLRPTSAQNSSQLPAKVIPLGSRSPKS